MFSMVDIGIGFAGTTSNTVGSDSVTPSSTIQNTNSASSDSVVKAISTTTKTSTKAYTSPTAAEYCTNYKY